MTNTANQAQRDAWNGDSGRRWVADPDTRDAVMVGIATALADAANLQRGEHVIDIGCGCGATTLDAARVVGPDGTALGVDISEPMLAVAETRLAASGLGNVAFRQADAQTDPLPKEAHDAAISRFGTMFFDDPVAAFTNIARSLRPRGRVCIVTWQPLGANEWLAVPGATLLRYGTLPEPGDNAPGMFAQSDPTRVAEVLSSAGFEDIHVDSTDTTMRLGVNADEATAYLTDLGLARAVLETIDPADRAQAIADVTAVLADFNGPNGVELRAGIWITTALRPT
jgi:SAM-dependent methyltransferase